MKRTVQDSALFRTPFSGGYWIHAAREFKSVRSLCIAAMIVALRVAVKSMKIPIIAEQLYVGIDFLVNSVGSMIYGPLMGLLVGAVSDTIGAFLFPIGPYFFPFIFVEMLSSFIFALFLYRAPLSAPRVVLSRFAVVVGCNFIVNPIIMQWYYTMLGRDMPFLRWATVVKNACLFPFEAVLLTLWIGAITNATYRMKLTYDEPGRVKLTDFTVAFTILLTLLAGYGLLYYYLFRYLLK